MIAFEIKGKRYERVAELGINDFRRINSNIEKLGYDSLHEFFEQGGERLFNSSAIYLYLALLFSEDSDFSEGAIAKRQKVFSNNTIDAAIAGEAITFFFEKLIALSQSSPTALYLLMKKKGVREKKKSAKKTKSTTKASSRKSSLKSHKETPLGVISSHAKT